MHIKLIDGTTIFTDCKNIMVRTNVDGSIWLWVSGTAQGEISKEEFENIKRTSLNVYCNSR
jgi:hypothetical protein